MSPFRNLSGIKPHSFWQLFWLGACNVLFVWPTYVATKTCMSLSTEYFGRKHHGNGPANAFRHALWNVLIAKGCFKSTHDPEQALKWAKQITDWHERAFFDKELPMKMDQHNNGVGRALFRNNPEWSQNQFLEALLLLAKNAVKIVDKADLNSLKNQMVYINDDH